MKNVLYILTILIMSSCHLKNTWKCEGNCIDGEGTKQWRDGGIERGYWKDGELTGLGYQYFGKTSEFAGDSYEGDFHNGNYHGYGKYIDVSEDAVFIGEWKNGSINGKGKSVWGKNSKYPQQSYDGEWKNGKHHGNGTKYYGESGEHARDKYEGEWKDGEPDGFGIYYWANGAYFVGEWKNGEQHGKGIYTFPDGEKLESVWRNGYCRELAIILWGESASTFHALIGEFHTLCKKSGQPLIDAMGFIINQLQTGSNSSINLEELMRIHLLAQKDISTALSQLANIDEYDSKIKLKAESADFLLATQELFNEFGNFLEVIANGGSYDEAIKDKLYERALLMKQQHDKSVEVEKEFAKKYLD